MKKFFIVLMMLTLGATSVYAAPRGSRGNYHGRRPAVTRHYNRVRVSRPDFGTYMLASFVGGVAAIAASSARPQVIYNQAPFSDYDSRVRCTTTVSYNGRRTTETCTTSRF